MKSGEIEHIAWIREQVGPDDRVPIGIGDDAAVLRLGENLLLMTTDLLTEGVHFDLGRCRPFEVGRKAMNVNLSDIAAMAGRPTAAVVAVALPGNSAEDLPAELFTGLCAAADAFDVALVGGDTNRSAGGLVVCVTLLGVPTGSGPVLRSGARVGDALCVTGRLGYSQAGSHLSFTPRVREAQRLHAACALHAMIDLSDGLGSDLFHLTDESNCGAILDADAVPIEPAPGCAGPDDRSPLDHAFNDGEDFELLFAVPPTDADLLLRDQPLEDLGVRIAHIGEIVAAPGVQLRQAGELRPLARGGFAHQW